MKNITIGILAHVDAGKTTLSEGILYLTGQLRKLGRVDHQDAFLDNFALERSRGITIFSKQAEFELPSHKMTLLDTPGHVDFSAEMERTLNVLDYAVLVVSASDGVQGHTQTLWKLLNTYHVPTFLFVNKMDQEGTDREKLLEDIKKNLDDNCIAFDAEDKELLLEEIAMTDEIILEKYMDCGEVSKDDIAALIAERKVFPCYFGSALKLEGVEEFLKALDTYMKEPEYSQEFGAKVFKISRGEQSERLTYLKITGGSLKVKTRLENDEKIDQIRLYNGSKYQLTDEVESGMICAVTGLSETAAGQGLGKEKELSAPILEPVLSYQLILPEGTDVTKVLRNLKILEEEEPSLHVTWNSRLVEIHVQLMGEVQTEILKSIMSSRFGMEVDFGQGNIMYKETIAEPSIGIGHYEPLRHYAEVQLLLEPLPEGSGIIVKSACSEDILDKNWQRLIMTHLLEKEHLGVLTGMPITDIRISVVAGRAHQKHTEGGDFRQATYRAVRQGLMKAESVLLEPWYEFRLEVPTEQIGRAMTDIQKKNGSFDTPEQEGEFAVLSGKAPVIDLQDYQKEVWAYTKGKGRLTLRLKGYEPCHNSEEVIEQIHYDSDNDLDNPSGSVFCSHGAGYYVPWKEVDERAHIREKTELITGVLPEQMMPERVPKKSNNSDLYAEDAEFLAIYEREFGAREERRVRSYDNKKIDFSVKSKVTAGDSKIKYKPQEKKKDYLLVDGYNIIFAWDELKHLAQADLGAARGKLMDILSNYQGYVGCTLILVFDAYKVEGNKGEIQKYHNIYVVYTKEAETADQYIEKTTNEIARKHNVTVATSDGLEQIIVMGQGAYRISARDLYDEIERIESRIREEFDMRKENDKNYLLEGLGDSLAKYIEKIRLGEDTKK